MKTPVTFLYRTPKTDFLPVSAGSGPLQIISKESPVNETVRELSVTWKNTGASPLCCQLEIRAETDFEYDHYVIPAVLYNGNIWGKGKEPKGLIYNGEPWVFDHRRTSVPACTISENSRRFFAMFASNKNAESLNASCSMIPCDGGRMIHRILFPGMEKPLTYCSRDQYSAPHEDYITLAPGECFRTSVFIAEGIPEKKYFAAAQVEDMALDLLSGAFPPRYAADELHSLCCDFAKRLLIETNGYKLICTGKYWKDGAYRHRVDYEFGWCGQNGMYARLFIQRGFETNDKDLIDTGIQLLDFWAERAGKTGLVYTNYDAHLIPNPVADTCNLGFAVCEFTKAYQYLAEKGIKKEKWLSAAKAVADFLISRYSTENGFGKAWNTETGECVDGSGTIGAYMISPLCMLYKATENSQYLEYAKTACRFYRDRDLSRFMCTAGALDTYCIDKETSGPLLFGSIALYEMEGSEEWLDCAKMAGWYFCSWMFHHDILPVPGSDFEICGYRTLGGTSVSAQHHHIDPWGALIVPDLLKLWKYTGDGHWKRRAELIWANAIQNIAPEEGMLFHGHRRLAGAQNEAYFHCCWGGRNAPGEINEWLVSWPQAYIWNTAVYLSEHPDISG